MKFGCLGFSTRKQQRGSVIAEFALSFPVFFLLLSSIIQLSNLTYIKLNMQYAISEAARYMVTGQGIDLTNTNPNARLTAIENKFCSKLFSTGFPCSSVHSNFTVTCVNPTVCTTPGQVSCAAGCTQAGGGPGQTVTLTASFSKNMLFRTFGPTVTISARTTWKNEQFL